MHLVILNFLAGYFAGFDYKILSSRAFSQMLDPESSHLDLRLLLLGCPLRRTEFGSLYQLQGYAAKNVKTPTTTTRGPRKGGVPKECHPDGIRRRNDKRTKYEPIY